jgi:hypothetical protein
MGVAGHVVAAQSVAEPSSFTLMMFGLVGLVVMTSGTKEKQKTRRCSKK